MTSTTPTARLIMVGSALVSFLLTLVALTTLGHHRGDARATLRSAPASVEAHQAVLVSSKKKPSVTDQAAHAVFVAINAQRKAHHLPALKWKTGLQRSSSGHDLQMSRTQQFSHQVSGEAFFATRISAQHVNWVAAGENIGWSSTLSAKGALKVHAMMMAEKAPDDGHKQNILSKSYDSVGIAVFIDHSHHRLYITEDFTKS